MSSIVLRFRGLSVAAKAALAVTLMVVLVVAALLGEYAMITANYDHADAAQRALIAKAKADEEAAIAAAVSYSDTRWCGALSVLTATPVAYPSDPAKNPSRVEAYQLYEDFVHIKANFRCT